jgi:hypothetical protein
VTHSDGGKGDKQRPTDHNAYSNNYDNIWKNQREKIVCTDCGKEFWLKPNEPHIHTCTPKENQHA